MIANNKQMLTKVSLKIAKKKNQSDFQFKNIFFRRWFYVGTF